MNDNTTTTQVSAAKRARLAPGRTPLTDRRPESIRLLTVPEVGEILRTSPKAIYSMVERCQIGGVRRIGKRLLFSERDLLEWLDRNCSPSAQETRR